MYFEESIFFLREITKENIKISNFSITHFSNHFFIYVIRAMGWSNFKKLKVDNLNCGISIILTEMAINESCY